MSAIIGSVQPEPSNDELRTKNRTIPGIRACGALARGSEIASTCVGIARGPA